MPETAAPDPKPASVTLTKEETAFFIKAFWEALLAPEWTRDHLIELGKAVYAKTPLAKLSDTDFTLFFPYLQTIAQKLGGKVIEQANAAAKKSLVEASGG